jgi:hypothetical protein
MSVASVAVRGERADRVNVRLYRAGDMVKRPSPVFLRPVLDAFDANKPAGRIGRADGLFCCVDMVDIVRWVRGNHMSGAPCKPHSFIYEGPDPYVYPVLLYEKAASSVEMLASTGREEWRIAVQAYWNAGVLLTDFKAHTSSILSGSAWRGGYEILIDPSYVRTSRPIGWKRFISATELCESDATLFRRIARSR